ncbi:MAG TPA: patatin-like phospholipase family protein [Kiritimatiellia bacterium]|nr:patatin-like phospholipase family protein [Kiritimatiellia bacterium]
MFSVLAVLVWLVGLPGFGETAPVAESGTSRPKIGLVLGGGGALGFAHVGVLRVLEESRVPIDYIAGTSMGSIIAGLYASGLSPDEIEQFLLGLDWWDVLNDKTPRNQLEFRQKADDGRYFGLDMGVKRSGLAMSAGMASGQKFNNLLELLTLRVAGVTNFSELPVPFRAVATDVEKGEMVVLSGGGIATAMRASMAVPGAFTPVLLDGRVLVDGGIVNNIPVDVVKTMGADVIIAVDVGNKSEAKKADRADTLGDVLGNTYAIMQRPKQLLQMANADVLIQPETWRYTASEFHRVAEIMPVGRQAAELRAADLSAYAVSDAAYDEYLKRQRLVPPPAPTVSTVRVTGNERVDGRLLEKRVFSEAGRPLETETVMRDLRRMYGLGEFEQIQFRADPEPDGRVALNFDAREKPWGPTYLKLGLNLKSDFENNADWGILANITRRSLNRLGAEWRNELQVGNRQRLLTEFYQPVDSRGFVFLAPSFEYEESVENIYEKEDKVAEYDIRVFKARFDLGVQLRHYAELRVGPVWGRGRADVSTGASDLPELDEDLGGVSVRLTADRLDRSAFPRGGYRAHVEYTGAEKDLGSDRGYDKLQAYYQHFWTVGAQTFHWGATGGSSLGSDLPEYDSFKLGGPFLFSGLTEGQLRGEYLGVASLGYRYRLTRLPPGLGQAVYLLFRGDIGNVWQESGDVDVGDTLVGGSAGWGADTILGPIAMTYGRAEGGYTSWYFSLGTSF